MRERIMFADDDPRPLGGLRRALSGQAWDMEFVNAAEKAEAALGAGPFDVMVVDIRMPGMSGLELLKALKSSEKMRETEVIVLTGMDGADLKRKALDLGAYDFLNTRLGLPVTEKIVANHAGCIAVESSPGKGSTLTVYLPATESRGTPAGLPGGDALEGSSV